MVDDLPADAVEVRIAWSVRGLVERQRAAWVLTERPLGPAVIQAV